MAYPCLNGGTCTTERKDGGQIACVCPSGLTGDRCELGRQIDIEHVRICVSASGRCYTYCSTRFLLLWLINCWNILFALQTTATPIRVKMEDGVPLSLMAMSVLVPRDTMVPTVRQVFSNSLNPWTTVSPAEDCYIIFFWIEDGHPLVKLHALTWRRSSGIKPWQDMILMKFAQWKTIFYSKEQERISRCRWRSSVQLCRTASY